MSLSLWQFVDSITAERGRKSSSQAVQPQSKITFYLQIRGQNANSTIIDSSDFEPTFSRAQLTDVLSGSKDIEADGQLRQGNEREEQWLLSQQSRVQSLQSLPTCTRSAMSTPGRRQCFEGFIWGGVWGVMRSPQVQCGATSFFASLFLSFLPLPLGTSASCKHSLALTHSYWAWAFGIASSVWTTSEI